MKSKVYFTPVTGSDTPETVREKLERLLDASGALDFIKSGDRVVLKIHFGEEGNTGHVRPDEARVIAGKVVQKGGRPVLCDTNTLYRGQRTNSRDHLRLAESHGFTPEATGAEIFIPEDTPENVVRVPVRQKYVREATVSRIFLEADGLVNIAHFKGHLMTAFGGSLKNIAMGCATREGKLAQHSDVSPLIHKDACVGCGACVAECPADAILIVEKKAGINGRSCIGCARCIAVCPQSAIDVNWGAGSGFIQEKMAAYGKAVIDRQRGRIACINFAVRITQECDCLAKDDPHVAPDMGIFVADDPVAVDKACHDMIIRTCGRDVLSELHPGRDAMKLLQCAAKLGLGNLSYDLIQPGGEAA